MVAHVSTFLPAVPGPALAEPLPQVAPERARAKVSVVLPLRIVSEANGREHWRQKAARARLHRATARAVLQRFARPMHDGVVWIDLVRIAPRQLDGDNLQSGFKATRDGVADWLGINDGSPRLQWSYHQRQGLPKQYAAEVVVMWEL